MKTLFATLTTVSLIGCAATYRPPTGEQVGAQGRFDQPKPQLFTAAKRALVAGGYQILSADEPSGTISTAARDYRLNPMQADCGTTMGINYLLDKRVHSRVAYGLVVDDGRIAVHAILQSEYKVGQSDQDITLTCISKGVLEQQFIDSLRQQIAAS